MTIKTRFSKGDKVYFLKGMEIKSMKIEEIRIAVTPKPTCLDGEEVYIKIRYIDAGHQHDLTEDYVYKTKEELLNSLKK